MSKHGARVLALSLLVVTLAATASAEVVLRPHDPATLERPTSPGTSIGFEKEDEPSALLIVPFYEVDTTDPSGDTTLYAVRNLESSTQTLEVTYFDLLGGILRTDAHEIAPLATRSVNIRDVDGLPADPDGFTRGWVTVVSTGDMAGDFFQVDVGGAFATGERMVSPPDICDRHEIRFLDFGSGTDLIIFLSQPQGADPMTDPFSIAVEVVDETGAEHTAAVVFTNQRVLLLTAADFTSQSFGTLVFDFDTSGGGWVLGSYSADGLLSAGINSTCTLP